MTTKFIFSFIFFLSIETCYGGPTTYNEFKELPQQQRDAIVADEDNPMHGKFIRWWWHLQIGDDEWLRKDQLRLIAQHDRVQLKLIFRLYSDLQKQFLLQEMDRKRTSGLSRKDIEVEEARVAKEYHHVDNNYNADIQMLSTVAQTQEAQQLNEKANLIVNAWIQKFPDGTKWVITPVAMSEVDNTKQKIEAQISKLPKSTPQEVQTQIDALPDDYPNVRGWEIPHK